MTRCATGRDDPALAETTWPLPDDEDDEALRDLEWHLRYGSPWRSQLLSAAEIVAAYDALITAGTTKQQTQRLAALRRVWRRRRTP